MWQSNVQQAKTPAQFTIVHIRACRVSRAPLQAHYASTLAPSSQSFPHPAHTMRTYSSRCKLCNLHTHTVCNGVSSLLRNFLRGNSSRGVLLLHWTKRQAQKHTQTHSIHKLLDVASQY